MKQSLRLPKTIYDWAPHQFMALLLVHAAHADLDYSSDERIKILEVISEEELIEVEAYYREKTDAQILQIVLNHKAQFLNTSETREVLLQEIKSVYNADGEVSKLEQTQYEFLKRLIMDTNS